MTSLLEGRCGMTGFGSVPGSEVVGSNDLASFLLNGVGPSDA